MVIEKTGHRSETQELLEKLEPYGVLEFTRSGRVAIMKSAKNLDAYLRELDSNKEMKPIRIPPIFKHFNNFNVIGEFTETS